MIEGLTLKAVLSVLRRFWWTFPIVALALWAWRIDGLRADYKQQRDDARQEYALFRKEVVAKATDALAAQKRVNANQEKEWKDKADAADQSIVDLRARLRAALVRGAGIGGSAGSGASAAAQADGSGLPQEVPSPAAGDSGSVCMKADTLAGLAAYAIQAHEWAISLAPQL